MSLLSTVIIPPSLDRYAMSIDINFNQIKDAMKMTMRRNNAQFAELKRIDFICSKDLI